VADLKKASFFGRNAARDGPWASCRQIDNIPAVNFSQELRCLGLCQLLNRLNSLKRTPLVPPVTRALNY